MGMDSDGALAYQSGRSQLGVEICAVGKAFVYAVTTVLKGVWCVLVARD